MKILIVHNNYLIPGGEDGVVKSEKKMLKQYGHKVFLYQRGNRENNYNFLMNVYDSVLPSSAI